VTRNEGLVRRNGRASQRLVTRNAGAWLEGDGDGLIRKSGKMGWKGWRGIG
jgi:hypothetical protein